MKKYKCRVYIVSIFNTVLCEAWTVGKTRKILTGILKY